MMRTIKAHRQVVMFADRGDVSRGDDCEQAIEGDGDAYRVLAMLIVRPKASVKLEEMKMKSL